MTGGKRAWPTPDLGGPAMTKSWKKRPDSSNWGEFGDDDQRGRMNLLTDERKIGRAHV